MFMSLIRIVALSVLGLVQFLMVMFGGLYFCEMLRPAYPWVWDLRPLAPVAGLATLLWPAFILAAAIRTRRSATEAARPAAKAEDR